MVAKQVVARRFPVGAEVQGDQTSFRVWAPSRRRVMLVLEMEDRPLEIPLNRQDVGYFEVITELAPSGTRYRFRLDSDEQLFPDPLSRFQPTGPHGPSQVVDPAEFEWQDQGWLGVKPEGQVLYEMHVGTFTPDGTWKAARRKLPHLVELGVTVLELMPVSDFAGEFGWGYDGVNLFAPTRLYGDPDDFRAFVDEAHRLGIGVILDVVYNHLGPDGNYLKAFSPNYFTGRYKTDWGPALNYDGDECGPVREMVAMNAAYWIDEYHLDGLRLDATQNIYDSSPDHILAAIARAARQAAGSREIFLVAENEPQDVRHVVSHEDGGFGLNALWNDDLHHTAIVALTGRREAYYHDYRGTPQELVSAVKWGYLYQGQYYAWQKQRRGTPAWQLSPCQFVSFLENHDQVANASGSLRPSCLAHPGQLRAMTALILLSPSTPMLFQGQEFSTTTPFYYFADHPPELAQKVAEGRREFMSQFPSVASEAVRQSIPDPAERTTFERSKLDWSEKERRATAFALHRDLIHLRRQDAVLST
ncbi:MAG: malto-oligosyltrehalose trehalohydrolase, partial [Pirellulaceae bacterium]